MNTKKKKKMSLKIKMARYTLHGSGARYPWSGISENHFLLYSRRI